MNKESVADHRQCNFVIYLITSDATRQIHHTSVPVQAND